MVPVGNEHGPVALGPGSAIGVFDRHVPAISFGLGGGGLGAEGDLLDQAEALGVVVEVLGHLPVAGVVRVVLRHGESLVGHQLASAVDVQRPIGGGGPVVVFEAPVPADHRPLLEAVEGNPAGAQDLAGGEAG